MNKGATRECELKYKISTVEIREALISKLLENGYKYIETRIETDFIFDTAYNDCKKNHVLFRIRHISTGNSANIIFTVKIKKNAENFQDNYEIETNVKEKKLLQSKFIVENVRKVTGIELPLSIFECFEIKKIFSDLLNMGFSKYEIMQKKRREYIGRKSKITFDTFPLSIGTYLEIETTSEEELFKIVDFLGLKIEDLEKRNYGIIVKEAYDGIVGLDKRVVVFDNELLIDSETGELITNKLQNFL